jgi:hypothetical protein
MIVRIAASHNASTLASTSGGSKNGSRYMTPASATKMTASIAIKYCRGLHEAEDPENLVGTATPLST